MSFALYLDTHIAKAVAVQLRKKGVDVVRCEEVDMAEATDLQHLEHASSQQRVLVTQDDDFLVLNAQWIREDRFHAGIFFVEPALRGQGAIGVIVKQIIELFDLIDAGAGTLEDDIVNQVTYIG